MSTGTEAKEFILARAAFNLAALSKLIDWSPQSMNDWLKGRRGIPYDKLKALQNLLSEYGFERGQNEAERSEQLFCPYCGVKKDFKVSTDINSGRVCKNVLCRAK